MQPSQERSTATVHETETIITADPTDTLLVGKAIGCATRPPDRHRQHSGKSLASIGSISPLTNDNDPRTFSLLSPPHLPNVGPRAFIQETGEALKSVFQVHFNLPAQASTLGGPKRNDRLRPTDRPVSQRRHRNWISDPFGNLAERWTFFQAVTRFFYLEKLAV